MKYNNSIFYILNAVLLLSILISISIPLPDYSIGLRKFLQHEDSRDIGEVLNSYSYPVKTYWNEKNVSRFELEKLYKKAWEKVEYSRNYLLDTKRVDAYNFILTTQFVYKLKNKSYKSTVRSKLNVKLNNNGKIVSIENIELHKSSGKALIKNTENLENEKTLTFNAFVRAFRYTLVFVFFIIVLNVWWFISYRNFGAKRKEQELIDKEKERLAKIEEERRWLIKTVKIDNIDKEKDKEILKLIERLKALNSENSSNYEVYKKTQILDLIRKKYASNVQLEKERLARIESLRFAQLEKDRLARLEKERLEKIEKARRAKIRAEQIKEERRLYKLEREKELKKREKIRIKKERLAKIEEEHQKQKLELLKLEREKERKKLKKIRIEKERLARIEEEHPKQKRELLEKERLEDAERNKNKKLPSNDLSQYLGKIDEDILNDERNQKNKDDDLGEYLTDFKK